MKKKVIVISALVFIFVMIMMVVSKRENVLSITTIKRSYSMVTLKEQSEDMVVPIFFSVKDNYYVKINNINECMIVDMNEENGLKVDVIDIVDIREELKLNDKVFYCYSFKIKINTNINYNLKEAYLKIIYLCDEIKINIGSFDYQIVEKFGGDELVSLSNLKGIINEEGNEKDIYGVFVGLKNKSNENIKITNIEVLNTNYRTSIYEVKEIDYIPEFTDNVSDILGYEYNYYKINETNGLSIYIDSNNTKFIFVHLKKIGNFNSNGFGLMIEIEIGKIKKNIYFDDFLFYTAKEKLRYEDFEVVNYENH